ncbi:MAG: IS66 family transposase [Synechococcales cyanobacterium CRU_2_2]|nr:IS66 family transposase [Synechococcales cyanobacterium CRU_2_2]
MKRLQPPPAYTRESLIETPVSSLVDIVLKQQEMIEQLFEEVERLKQIINRDSRTSSKPPSSDLVKRSEKPSEPEPGCSQKRKAGGQPGHPGKTRKGFGRVDRVEFLRPERCWHCGGVDFEATVLGSQAQEVAEFAARPIEVVRYERATCRCQGCGYDSTAALPPTVIPGQDLGVSLQAMLSWLSHYGHLSYEKQQEWLWELGQIQVGLGTLQATTQRVAAALSAPVEELHQWIQHHHHVQVDESPWLVKGVKEWMWVATGVGFCLFHAGDTRSRAELEVILGKSFAGVLSTDDFCVYNGYAVSAQQKCLAHVRRHFKQVMKLKPSSQAELGQVFIRLIDEAFEHHAQWRETQDAAAYAQWAAQFKGRVTQAITTWKPQAGYAAMLLLRSLTQKAHQWWYFLDHPEIPPDNNRSERAIRLAVTKRNVCGGSRSMKGFADTATILTVIQTCRAQARSVPQFIISALGQSAGRFDLIPAPLT